MEDCDLAEHLYGKLMAQASLLNSLLRVLPIAPLQALEAELQRDTTFWTDLLVAQPMTETTIESFGQQSAENLKLVCGLIERARASPPPSASDPRL